MILSRSPIRISEISPSWGAASSATGLNKGLDGILGVGPVNLASDTVSNTSTVPAVLEISLRKERSRRKSGVYVLRPRFRA